MTSIIDIEAAAAESAAAILREAGPIAETLAHYDAARLRDVDPRDITGNDAEATARIWASYGFDDAQVQAWLDAGIYVPGVAGDLAHFGVSPFGEWAGEDFAGMPLGVALCEGHCNAGEVLHRAEVLQ